MYDVTAVVTCGRSVRSMSVKLIVPVVLSLPELLVPACSENELPVAVSTGASSVDFSVTSVSFEPSFDPRKTACE